MNEQVHSLAANGVLPMVGRLAHPIPESCALLGGISRAKLYELLKSGDLKSIKIGGRTFIPRSELDRLTRVDQHEAA